MDFSKVVRESSSRLALTGTGSTKRFLNGSVYRLARVEREESVLYVVSTENTRPELLAVRLADSASQEILDAAPARVDIAVVDRLFARLEKSEPDVFAEESVAGRLAYSDTVLTVIGGARRWDFAIDREPVPTVRAVETTPEVPISVRLRMPDDEAIHLAVDEEFADSTYRALAVLKAAGVGPARPEQIRWQYGVVNIGMFSAMDRMKSVFESLGSDGWELVTIYDKSSNWLSGMEKGFMLFKRPVAPGIRLKPGQWCRSITATGLWS
jgi:hypothetical protein